MCHGPFLQMTSCSFIDAYVIQLIKLMAGILKKYVV